MSREPVVIEEESLSEDTRRSKAHHIRYPNAIAFEDWDDPSRTFAQRMEEWRLERMLSEVNELLNETPLSNHDHHHHQSSHLTSSSSSNALVPSTTTTTGGLRRASSSFATLSTPSATAALLARNRSMTRNSGSRASFASLAHIRNPSGLSSSSSVSTISSIQESVEPNSTTNNNNNNNNNNTVSFNHGQSSHALASNNQLSKHHFQKDFSPSSSNHNHPSQNHRHSLSNSFSSQGLSSTSNFNNNNNNNNNNTDNDIDDPVQDTLLALPTPAVLAFNNPSSRSLKSLRELRAERADVLDSVAAPPRPPQPIPFVEAFLESLSDITPTESLPTDLINHFQSRLAALVSQKSMVLSRWRATAADLRLIEGAPGSQYAELIARHTSEAIDAEERLLRLRTAPDSGSVQDLRFYLRALGHDESTSRPLRRFLTKLKWTPYTARIELWQRATQLKASTAESSPQEAPLLISADADLDAIINDMKAPLGITASLHEKDGHEVYYQVNKTFSASFTAQANASTFPEHGAPSLAHVQATLAAEAEASNSAPSASSSSLTGKGNNNNNNNTAGASSSSSGGSAAKSSTAATPAEDTEIRLAADVQVLKQPDKDWCPEPVAVGYAGMAQAHPPFGGPDLQTAQLLAVSLRSAKAAPHLVVENGFLASNDKDYVLKRFKELAESHEARARRNISSPVATADGPNHDQGSTSASGSGPAPSSSTAPGMQTTAPSLSRWAPRPSAIATPAAPAPVAPPTSTPTTDPSAPLSIYKLLAMHYLRHTTTRSHRATILSILNYFRSVERKLHYDAKAEEAAVPATLSSNSPAFLNVAAAPPTTTPLPSNSDTWTVLEGPAQYELRVKDSSGTFVMYAPALTDWTATQDHLLAIASHYLSQAALAPTTSTDILAVLADLYACEAWWAEAKQRAIDAYLLIYEHTSDPEARQHLRSAIKATANARPTLDLHAKYFLEAYTSEVLALQQYAVLLKEVASAQMRNEKAAIRKLYSHWGRDEKEPALWGLPPRIKPGLPVPTSASSPVATGIFDWFSSLGSILDVPAALASAFDNLSVAHNTAKSPIMASALSRALVQQALIEWRLIYEESKLRSALSVASPAAPAIADDPLALEAVVESAYGGEPTSPLALPTFTAAIAFVKHRRALMDAAYESDLLSATYEAQATTFGVLTDVIIPPWAHSNVFNPSRPVSNPSSNAPLMNSHQLGASQDLLAPQREVIDALEGSAEARNRLQIAAWDMSLADRLDYGTAEGIKSAFSKSGSAVLATASRLQAAEAAALAAAVIRNAVPMTPLARNHADALTKIKAQNTAETFVTSSGRGNTAPGYEASRRRAEAIRVATATETARFRSEIATITHLFTRLHPVQTGLRRRAAVAYDEAHASNLQLPGASSKNESLKLSLINSYIDALSAQATTVYAHQVEILEQADAIRGLVAASGMSMKEYRGGPTAPTAFFATSDWTQNLANPWAVPSIKETYAVVDSAALKDVAGGLRACADVLGLSLALVGLSLDSVDVLNNPSAAQEAMQTVILKIQNEHEHSMSGAQLGGWRRFLEQKRTILYLRAVAALRGLLNHPSVDVKVIQNQLEVLTTESVRNPLLLSVPEALRNLAHGEDLGVEMLLDDLLTIHDVYATAAPEEAMRLQLECLDMCAALWQTREKYLSMPQAESETPDKILKRVLARIRDPHAPPVAGLRALEEDSVWNGDSSNDREGGSSIAKSQAGVPEVSLRKVEAGIVSQLLDHVLIQQASEAVESILKRLRFSKAAMSASPMQMIPSKSGMLPSFEEGALREGIKTGSEAITAALSKFSSSSGDYPVQALIELGADLASWEATARESLQADLVAERESLEAVISSKDATIRHLLRILEEERVAAARRIHAEVTDKGYDLIFEIDSLNWALSEANRASETAASGIRAEVRAEYDSLVRQLSSEVAVLKSRFKEYRSALYSDIVENLHDVKQEALNKIAESNKAPLDLRRAMAKVSKQEGELKEVKLENEELRRVVLKLRTMSALKDAGLRSGYEKRLESLEGDKAIVNRALWENKTRIERRERMLREQLNATQGALAAAQSEVDNLRKALVLQQRNKLSLVQWKVSKSQLLEELESKVAMYERWNSINVDKLLNELAKKEREVALLSETQSGAINAGTTKAQNNAKELKRLRAELAKERRLKMEAFEKLERLQEFGRLESATVPRSAPDSTRSRAPKIRSRPSTAPDGSFLSPGSSMSRSSTASKARPSPTPTPKLAVRGGVRRISTTPRTFPSVRLSEAQGTTTRPDTSPA